GHGAGQGQGGGAGSPAPSASPAGSAAASDAARPDAAGAGAASAGGGTGSAQTSGPDGPGQTSDERRAGLDKRLDDSLGSFDAELRTEQQRVAQERDTRRASAAGSAAAEGQGADKNADKSADTSGSAGTEVPAPDDKPSGTHRRGDASRRRDTSGDLKSEKASKKLGENLRRGMRWGLAAAGCVALVAAAGCVVNESKPLPKVNPIQADRQIPQDELLDVVVHPLDPGIPPNLDPKALDKQRINPDIR